MTEAETAHLVHNLLHDLGYKAEMIDESAVGSAASGLKFYIQSYSASIQFRCVLGLESGIGGWLEFANAFNKQMRFVKVYVDADDGDESLLAETDWWFDPEGADHVNSFGQAVDFWELSLAALKEKLREQARLSSPQAAEGM